MEMQVADYNSSVFNPCRSLSTSEFTSSSYSVASEASSRVSSSSVLDDSLAIDGKQTVSFATCPRDELLHSGMAQGLVECRDGCYPSHTYPLTSTPEIPRHHGAIITKSLRRTRNTFSNFAAGFKNQPLSEPSVINNTSNAQEFLSSVLESTALSNSNLSMSMPAEIPSGSYDVKSRVSSSNDSYPSCDSPCYNAHTSVDKRNSRYWQLKNPSDDEISKIKRIASMLSTGTSRSPASKAWTDSEIEIQSPRHNVRDKISAFKETELIPTRDVGSPGTYTKNGLDAQVIKQRHRNMHLTEHVIREVKKANILLDSIAQTSYKHRMARDPHIGLQEESQSFKTGQGSISGAHLMIGTRRPLPARTPKTRHLTDLTTTSMEVDLSPDLNMLASCSFQFPTLPAENEIRPCNSEIPRCKRKLTFSTDEWSAKRARHCDDQESYENGVHHRRGRHQGDEQKCCSVHNRDRKVCDKFAKRDTHFSSEDEEAVFYLISKYLRNV